MDERLSPSSAGMSNLFFDTIFQGIDFHCNVIDRSYRIVWHNRVEDEGRRAGLFCHEFYQDRKDPCVERCPVRFVLESGEPCMVERKRLSKSPERPFPVGRDKGFSRFRRRRPGRIRRDDRLRYNGQETCGRKAAGTGGNASEEVGGVVAGRSPSNGRKNPCTPDRTGIPGIEAHRRRPQQHRNCRSPFNKPPYSKNSRYPHFQQAGANDRTRRQSLQPA